MRRGQHVTVHYSPFTACTPPYTTHFSMHCSPRLETLMQSSSPVVATLAWVPILGVVVIAVAEERLTGQAFIPA